MTQPEDACAIAPTDGQSPPQISRLKRRADFQRAARGVRQRCEAFGLQANRRAAEGDGLGPRIGFTLTKKVGGAVVRNRIRRRLKEAVRLSSQLETRPDHDYVVMAQRPALARRFDLLAADLQRAFAAIHARSPRPGRPRRFDKDERQ
jgi:ribonuclease P protein component